MRTQLSILFKSQGIASTKCTANFFLSFRCSYSVPLCMCVDWLKLKPPAEALCIQIFTGYVTRKRNNGKIHKNSEHTKPNVEVDFSFAFLCLSGLFFVFKSVFVLKALNQSLKLLFNCLLASKSIKNESEVFKNGCFIAKMMSIIIHQTVGISLLFSFFNGVSFWQLLAINLENEMCFLMRDFLDLSHLTNSIY